MLTALKCVLGQSCYHHRSHLQNYPTTPFPEYAARTKVLYSPNENEYLPTAKSHNGLRAFKLSRKPIYQQIKALHRHGTGILCIRKNRAITWKEFAKGIVLIAGEWVQDLQAVTNLRFTYTDTKTICAHTHTH